MPNGWVDVTEWGRNPNYDPNFRGGPWNDTRKRTHIQIPTGKQRCPDCAFTTDSTDMVGPHTCPELIDGQENKFTIGDKVYVITRGRIMWGEVTKWNQATEKLSVLIEAEDPWVVVLNSPRKALRMDHLDNTI